MKLLVFALLVFCSSISYAQKCNCDFLINPEYDKTIPVYDQPNGKVVKNAKHDIQQEAFLTGVILQDSAGFFKVSIKHNMMKVTYKGWIKKAEYIGTMTKDYSGELKLYTDADVKSKVKEVVNGMNGMYTVKQCKRKWPFAEITIEGKVHNGWLNPKDQCNNPFTTCN